MLPISKTVPNACGNLEGNGSVVYYVYVASDETRTVTTRMTLSVYFRQSRKYCCGLLSTVSLVTMSMKVNLLVLI